MTRGEKMSPEINRTALIVKPKQPFADWLTAVDPRGSLTLPEIREDTTVFLLPDEAFQMDLEKVLREFFEDIFEQVLWEWATDEGDWPKERSYEKFREWFDVEFHSGVIDLAEDPIDQIE